MSFLVGLDIGGTKLAGAAFASDGREIAQIITPTGDDYSEIVTTCRKIVEEFDRKCGVKVSVGVGVPGAIDINTGDVPFTGNTPALDGKPLKKDLEKVLGRDVRMANDADCAALSEAVDGAGAGFKTVFGLIMGTGIGGGFIANGKLVQGVNGLTGEFGHIAVPFADNDIPVTECVCRQPRCIDKSISGPGLARLYQHMVGKPLSAKDIAEQARHGDKDALRVLDKFYDVVAKSMVVIIHTFDPEVIVVSGGLCQLPKLYDEIPKRWGQYAICKEPKTKFVPAKHGAMSGLRGAAWLWK